MKIARMLTGWSGGYYEGINDVVEVSDDDYEGLIDSNQAEPVCTNNPHVAAASMAEAAVRLDVELTTSNADLAAYLKSYGATVHVKKAKK